MSGAMPPMGTPYAADGRPITKVGIAFSSKDRNITEWRCDLFGRDVSRPKAQNEENVGSAGVPTRY